MRASVTRMMNRRYWPVDDIGALSMLPSLTLTHLTVPTTTHSTAILTWTWNRLLSYFNGSQRSHRPSPRYWLCIGPKSGMIHGCHNGNGKSYSAGEESFCTTAGVFTIVLSTTNRTSHSCAIIRCVCERFNLWDKFGLFYMLIWLSNYLISTLWVKGGCDFFLCWGYRVISAALCWPTSSWMMNLP